MPKDKKPLPTPPGPGRQRRSEEDPQDDPLIADKMGMAMATGNLDKYMKEEFEGSENAHKLASMMMGMTGMAPQGVPTQGVPTQGVPTQSVPAPPEGQEAPSGEPPPSGETPSHPPSEEIMKAAMSGDSKGLAEMLKKEHLRRQGAGADVSEEKPSQMQDPVKEESQAPADAAMEKEVLEKLMKIASENNVSIDWVINRALKLYVRDYEGTGRV